MTINIKNYVIQELEAYMREEYKLTEADRNASFIFLLDGFNEIPTTTMQIRCLRDTGRDVFCWNRQNRTMTAAMTIKMRPLPASVQQM